MCFARMVGSSTGSSLDRTSHGGCCVVASVARLMAGHRIAHDFESLGEEWYHSNASPYATQHRKQKDDLTDKTLKSAQKPEKIDGETWLVVGIRIEVRLAQKTFKSRWETWEDSELYANGNEFGKRSK